MFGRKNNQVKEPKSFAQIVIKLGSDVVTRVVCLPTRPTKEEMTKTIEKLNSVKGTFVEIENIYCRVDDILTVWYYSE